MSLQETNVESRFEEQSASGSDDTSAAFQESQSSMREMCQQGRMSDLNSKGSVPDEFGTIDLYDGKSVPSEYVFAKATAEPIEPKKEAAPSKAPDDYKGEKGIKYDVPNETHTVKPGDTLEGIARKHLGPTATDAEVARHAQEIAKVNDIKNPRMIHPGDKLQVPGHTKDGGFITTDEFGSRHTQYEDGRYTWEAKDGSKGMHRTPDGKGGYYEQGWGRKDDDNYIIQKTKDGQYMISDRQGNARNPLYPNEERIIREVRQRDIADRKYHESKQQPAQKKGVYL